MPAFNELFQIDIVIIIKYNNFRKQVLWTVVVIRKEINMKSISKDNHYNDDVSNVIVDDCCCNLGSDDYEEISIIKAAPITLDELKRLL